MQVQKTKQGYKLVKSLFGKYEEIPEYWNFQQLGKLTKVTDGSHYSPEKVSSGFPLATVENVKGDSIDIDSCYQISKDDYEQLVKNGTQPEIGDVLFTKDGTVGKTLVYNQKTKIVVLSSIAIIRKSKKIDSDYCNYVLQSKFMTKHLAKYFGGTAIKRIVLRHLSKYEFPIPPYSEQQKIASILSTVDDLINKYDSTIESTKKIKTSLMQQLLTKGIGHKKFKEITLYPKYLSTEIPESWELNFLSDVTKKIADRDHFTPMYVEKGMPIISPKDIDDNMCLKLDNIKYITKEAHEKNYNKTDIQPFDIIFSRIGARLGKSLLVNENFYNFSILHSLCQIRTNENLLPQYLLYSLRSNLIQKRIWVTVQSIGVPDLGLKEIGNFPIFVPELSEQKKIALILSEVDSKISELESKKSRIKFLKKGLMQKLLTGQIRV